MSNATLQETSRVHTCPFHYARQIRFYCQSCNHVACNTCVTVGHIGHYIKELVVVYQPIRQLDISESLQKFHISETDEHENQVKN